MQELRRPCGRYSSWSRMEALWSKGRRQGFIAAILECPGSSCPRGRASKEVEHRPLVMPLGFRASGCSPGMTDPPFSLHPYSGGLLAGTRLGWSPFTAGGTPALPGQRTRSATGVCRVALPIMTPQARRPSPRLCSRGPVRGYDVSASGFHAAGERLPRKPCVPALHLASP